MPCAGADSAPRRAGHGALAPALAAWLAAAGCAAEAPVLPLTAAGVDSLRNASPARVVLLNVWATWCAPCREEMPELLRLRREYPPGDLDVVLLSADHASELDSAVIPFLRSAGVDFPTYISAEPDQDALIRSVDPDWSGALPATVLTVRGREARTVLVGRQRYEQFQRAVDALLAE